MIYTDDYWKEIKKNIKNITNYKKLFNKSLLITGSTGMICSAVVDFLLYLNKFEDAKIRIYLAGRSKEKAKKRFYPFQESEDYYFVLYDAERYQLLNYKIDYVIHGASNANPTLYSKYPVETLFGNVIGIKSILDSALKNNWKRVLYISSSEIYGKKKESKLFNEDDYEYVDILNPRACYPNSKRISETICASYRNEYSIDSVIVRPGHIYGHTMTKSDTRASSEFARNSMNGLDIIMKSEGTQLRSYCFVYDCVTAIITVLLNGKSGEAYNISNKKSIVTIKEVAEKFSEISGVNLTFEVPTINEKKGYNLMNNSALDSEKIELLGWKGIYDLNTGVGKTLQFLKLMS